MSNKDTTPARGKPDESKKADEAQKQKNLNKAKVPVNRPDETVNTGPQGAPQNETTTAEAAAGRKSDLDLKHAEEDRKREEERADPAGIRKMRENDKAGDWTSVTVTNQEAGIFNEVSQLGVEDEGKGSGKKAKVEEPKGSGSTDKGPNAPVG